MERYGRAAKGLLKVALLKSSLTLSHPTTSRQYVIIIVIVIVIVMVSSHGRHSAGHLNRSVMHRECNMHESDGQNCFT